MKKILLILLFFLISSCSNNFEIVDDLSKTNYELVDQNNNSVLFPQVAKGKINVIGYIFTNCPDICPLTTNNMRLIQEKLKKEKIDGVQFISISFDPLQDKPETLRKFAEVRNLDLSNWIFLTGDKSVIDSLMKRVNILAVKSDSTTFKDGRKIYYYVHTDRIQLMDKENKILKNYKGSSVNVDEIINDIKKLN
ncbi:MAG: SCO family protein [Melioribacteraceae bacterium]|nr:SCO family protein [Melioribacteraceae bacterium]